MPHASMESICERDATTEKVYEWRAAKDDEQTTINGIQEMAGYC